MRTGPARSACVTLAVLVCAVACADDAKPAPLPKGAVARFGSSDFHHGGLISGFVALDGGKKFATLSDAELFIWDAATGRVLDTVRLPVVAKPSPPLRAPVYPSGWGLVATADESTLFVIRNGIAHAVTAPFARAKVVALPQLKAPDYLRSIVPFGRSGVLAQAARNEMYSFETGEREWKAAGFKFENPIGSFAHGAGVIAATPLKGAITVYDTRIGKALEPVNRPAGWFGVSVSADGKWLGIGARGDGAGAAVEVHSLTDRKVVHRWNAGANPPFGAPLLALSPSGTRAAIADASDTRFEVYECRTGKLLRTVEVAEKGVQQLAFLSEDTVVALGLPNTAQGAVRAFDATTGKRLSPERVARVTALIPIQKDEWLTGGSDGAITGWADGQSKLVAAHKTGITALVVGPEDRLYSSGVDGSVRLWDRKTGKQQRVAAFTMSFGKGKGIPTAVVGLALAPDGKALAAGVGRGEVRVLDPGDLSERAVLRPTDLIRGESISPQFVTNTQLVVRETDKAIRVWDLDKQTSRTIYADAGSPDQARYRRSAVAPDGKLVVGTLATTDPNRTGDATDAGVWEIATGKLQHRVPTGTAGYVTAVAFVDGGKAVAVGDSLGVVRVFELGAKEPKHTFSGHRGPVLCLALSHDGKHLASGGSDATVLVWNLGAK